MRRLRSGERSMVRTALGFTFAVFLVVSPGAVFAAKKGASQTSPGLKEAMFLLQRGDFAGAAKIAEDLSSREPENAQAWRTLCAASLKLKDPDRALAACARLLQLQPQQPAALYNTGVAYAMKQDADQAFVWLAKAKATAKLDMTQIDVDADLAGLKDDPRFAALRPKPEDFEHPFVEPVKIVREWDGEAAGDQFGWIARVLGDVDGDGVPDFVTSAPTSGAAGENAGRVYVYSTKTGKLIWQADGEPGDQLGTGVESAGDVDGDGVPDVIAGAPGTNGVGGGKAYVYSGKDGQVLLRFTASPTDSFGQHVAGVGDVDHDGHADVMVGAPTEATGGKRAGRAYLYSGKDGHVLLTLTGKRAGDALGSTVAGAVTNGKLTLMVGAPGAGSHKTGSTYIYDRLTTTPKFTLNSDASGIAFGAMFIAPLGDTDGDGVPDLYISDWTNSAKGPSTGRVYVYSGKTGKLLYALTGETAGEGFGTTHATAGDVDGDGRADLIVGAWQYAGAAISGGRAQLFSGRDGRLLATYTCRTPGDTFGFDAVGIGDVDGDGTVDLLITSGWSGVHGNHSGRVFIISSGVEQTHR